MEHPNFSELPPEEKKRLGLIEGRGDLLGTKVLRLYSESTEPSSGTKDTLFVTARDPGSAAALTPVLEVLKSDQNVDLVALTDGRAEETLKKRFVTEDLTPPNSIFEVSEELPTPDALLINASSNPGIETFASATYHEVPAIVVEDYYTSSLHYVARLKEIQQSIPERASPEVICVMDEEAKRILVEAYPDMEPLVKVTGQPAFDRIANEDTLAIAKDIRSRLGLRAEQRLVTFMSQMQPKEMAIDLARAMQQAKSKFVFAFRRHPRDNVSADEYRQTLSDAGIETIDTDAYTVDEISAASDLVMTAFSTAGLEGIYRRKPTIHIMDPAHQEIPKELPVPLPPVKLGASVGVDRMDELPAAIDALLAENSLLRDSLTQNMERFYPRDAKNAERVAALVREQLRRT